MFLLFAAVQIFFKHLSKIVYLVDGIENDVPEYLRRHECKFFHYFISPSCIKFKITLAIAQHVGHSLLERLPMPKEISKPSSK